MKSIHHVVDIDAPPEQVWRRLTKPSEGDMAGWWSTVVDAPSADVGTQVRWTFVGAMEPC